MINRSELAAMAADVDIAPPGNIEKSFQCNLCGEAFEKGGYQYKTSPKFNNQADTHGTETLCRFCKTVTTGSTFILTHKCAVYSKQGVQSLNKDIQIASFIRKPPKPPFVAVYGTTKQQHLVWRTPVSYSDKVFHFRYGDTLCAIDRNMVIKAAKSYRAAIDAINPALLDAGIIKKPLTNLFDAPTSGIRSSDNPSAVILNRHIRRVLKTDLFTAAQKTTLSKAVNDIYDMNYGELFLMIATSKFDDSDINQFLDKVN